MSLIIEIDHQVLMMSPEPTTDLFARRGTG
jgi:hypothetical protein